MKKLSVVKVLVVSLLVLSLLAVPLVAACAKPAGPVATWYYERGRSGKAGEPWYDAQASLMDVIEKASGGTVDVVLQEELIKEKEMIDAVRDRILEVALQGSSKRAEFAAWNFPRLPIVPYEKQPEILDLLFPRMQEIAEKEVGAVLLGFSYYPPQFIFSKKPLATVADLKGYKIRTLGYELTKMLEANGAAPISVPYGEVYESLQRGMLDGASSSVQSLIKVGWHEVCKYINHWPIGSTYLWVFMNKDAWNELGPDGQEKLMKAMPKFDKDNWEAANKQYELNLDAAEKMGITFVEPSQAEKDKFLANANFLVDDWKKRAGPFGAEVMAAINKVMGTNY